MSYSFSFYDLHHSVICFVVKQGLCIIMLYFLKLSKIRINKWQKSQCILFLLDRGIPTVPGTVCLKKDTNNLIGISIGGGAQYCPCLYIVQVSTNSVYESVTEHFHQVRNVRAEHIFNAFVKHQRDTVAVQHLIKSEGKCLHTVCHWYLFNVVSVVSQVFDNTPAALDGTLAAGDEITGVNGKPVKGKTKVEVAKMIQAVQVHKCQELIHSREQHQVQMANYLPPLHSVDTQSGFEPLLCSLLCQ